MKKLLLLLLFIPLLSAQTILNHEDFNAPSGPNSIGSLGYNQVVSRAAADASYFISSINFNNYKPDCT